MITGVSLSTIAHSTEDVSKVRDAISNLVPETVRGVVRINATEAKGHHGNPITVLSIDTRGKEGAREITEHIMRLLPLGDKIRIKDQIDLYYDGRSAFFLRLDKQSAFLGSPRISTSDDVIRIKINFISRRNDLAAVLRLLGLA
jgi:hypothetical protein